MNRLTFGTWALLLSATTLMADEAEDRAEKAVRRMDGTVKRDKNLPGNPVVVVDMPYGLIDDARLKELTPFKQLTTLNLYQTQVTDAGVKELATFKKLTSLCLGSTRVTDA